MREKTLEPEGLLRSARRADVDRRAAVGDALAPSLIAAVRAGGGYGGGVYLPSRDRRSLVLTMLAGVPRSLLKSWWRLPVNGALPAPEAYRTERAVLLRDEGETTRRYPQMAAGLPYTLGSAYQPLRVHGEVVGVLVVMWSAAGAGPAGGSTAPGDGDALRLRTAADAMEESLAELEARGCRIEYDGEPVSVRLPASGAAGRYLGLIEWDLGSGRILADAEACAVLGTDAASFGGTAEALENRVCPDDIYELRASVQDAEHHGRVRGRRFRVRDERDGVSRYRAVELWGRVARPDGEDGGMATRRLVGVVFDAATVTTAAEAAERLPDGIFSLDQDGRVTFTNHRCEQLLRCGCDVLLGRHPWRVLTWLSDPAYEDRYRAAMFSQEPTSFLVRHPAGEWLGFVLYPDVHGLTGRVFSSEAPPQPEARPEAFPEPKLPAAPSIPVTPPARSTTSYRWPAS